MMKFLVVLAAVVLTANAVSNRELWAEFKELFGRNYKSLREEQLRFSIFQQNVRFIDEHNEKYERGQSSYTMGINHFADMSTDEFKAMLNRSARARPVFEKPVWHKLSGVAAPESVDWVSKGVVSEVKSQGSCGSCWAFSATGAMEGAHAIQSGQLVSFSEQNLVDCCEINAGCDGGWMQAAFDYVRDNGIETESDYPYEAVQRSCKFERSKSVFNVAGFVNLPADENGIMDAVATVGPLSASMDADHFQFYSSGIFDEPECNPENLDHGILIVGYDSLNGVPYWHIKNSWGADWGEAGYFKLARGKNMCGISYGATYPTL